MKITDAQILVCSPGQNYVTLRIETDAGVHGLGDATLNGRELAVAAYLSDHVIPLLIGRDPFDTEATWQYLYQGAYWPPGLVGMTAISAVDVALWDIKGKALDTPLYDLLGGQSRQAVLAYAHAHGTLDEAIAQVARWVQDGFTAVRVQPTIPGLPGSYRELHTAPPADPHSGRVGADNPISLCGLGILVDEPAEAITS